MRGSIYNMPLRQRGFAKARLEDKLLFYQGVLHPYRGLEEVILALRMVPGWRLWIAGDGKHRAYLEAMVRQEGLQDRVLFWGYCPMRRRWDMLGRRLWGFRGNCL